MEELGIRFSLHNFDFASTSLKDWKGAVRLQKRVQVQLCCWIPPSSSPPQLSPLLFHPWQVLPIPLVYYSACCQKALYGCFSEAATSGTHILLTSERLGCKWIFAEYREKMPMHVFQDAIKSTSAGAPWKPCFSPLKIQHLNYVWSHDISITPTPIGTVAADDWLWP